MGYSPLPGRLSPSKKGYPGSYLFPEAARFKGKPSLEKVETFGGGWS